MPGEQPQRSTQHPQTPGDADSGIVVADKPAGWTSHQVVARVRRVAGTRKVGHAGTLDPMATGVLLLGLNRATRLLGHLMLTEKEYTATIRLGQATLTDDAEGEITAYAPVDGLDRARIERAVAAFRGRILQVPTQVSAIKIDGQRSYARVRAGEQVELKARPVDVWAFAVHDVRPLSVGGCEVVDCDVSVRCSSGTYVRALARDLGEALGSAGHLTALRRTRVGPFGLDRAQLVDHNTQHLTMVGIDEVAPACFPTREVSADDAAGIRNGRALPRLELDGLTAMMHRGRFLALYRPDGSGAVAEAVFCSG